jgi:hypothetical protein
MPGVPRIICGKIQNSFTTRATGVISAVYSESDEAAIGRWATFLTPRTCFEDVALCSPETQFGTEALEMGLHFCRKSLETLVPVERIELPTFGLQNRCSTAELNRRTKLQWSNRRSKGFVSFCLPQSVPTGRARRQITELFAKGYRHESAPKGICESRPSSIEPGLKGQSARRGVGDARRACSPRLRGYT